MAFFLGKWRYRLWHDLRLRGWLEENYQAYVLADRVGIDGSEGLTQVAVEKVIAEQPVETWQRLFGNAYLLVLR